MPGLIRSLDDLGRLNIPVEIRRSFNMEPGDQIEIETVSGGILLTPVKSSCVFCGSIKDIINIDGLGVCRSCAAIINAKLIEGETT